MTKHFKDGPTLLTYYSAPVAQDELDTLDNFDDRTLRHLAGSGSRRPLSDGVENENPTKALGLDRWQDRLLRFK